MVLQNLLWFNNPRLGLTSLLIFYLLFLHATADNPKLQPIKANCTGQSYAQNSTFATNLAAVLSSLTTKSSLSNSATSNVTTRNSSDHVYGLFMCQAGLASSDCQTCISAAATTITTNSCPTSRQAVIWYDRCELRYSDSNFFGIPDTAGFSMNNPNQKTSSPEPFAVVADLVKPAPLNKPLMFASKALVNDSIYALAQCTIDLSVDGCRECLTTILADIKNCCTQWEGWRYLATSCWVRYESTPFLQNSNGTPTVITKHSCSASTFPSNSLAIVESNRNNLLQNLTTKAQTSGFYNTTVGENSDQLYGLALCRGDLTPPSNDCNTCLVDARDTITGDCPNNTEGIKWYEKCLMRYSNSNFFGVVDLAGQTLCGVQQIDQATGDATIKFSRGLVEQALNNPVLVASGRESVTSQLASYVLVQCTRDLNRAGCKNCLEAGLSQVKAHCNQTNGWRYLSGSCTLRYEVFPFFNTSAISTPGSPPIASPQGDSRSRPIASPQGDSRRSWAVNQKNLGFTRIIFILIIFDVISTFMQDFLRI